MISSIVWILLAVTVLYVIKVLYDLNFRDPAQESASPNPYRLHESFLEATTKEGFLAIPTQQPVPVNPRDSLKEALEYQVELAMGKGVSPSQEASKHHSEKLLVVKESIPETKGIDLESFVYFQGARILVVDDMPINQKIIEKILMYSGVEITFAANGEEALERLFTAHKDFDLVLMDISMPVMNGITATKIIRRSQRFVALPIVTFTAFSLGNEIEAMFKAGANAYITKPINIEQLYTVFQLYIGNVNRGLSFEKMFQLQGLNVKLGREHALQKGVHYEEMLEHFMMQYISSAKLMPEWIGRKRFERVRLECKQLLPKLQEIGAESMYELVHEMQMQFVYRNPHLLDKYALRYRIGMQTLIETIEAYLKEHKKKSV